ncbi:MAG: thiamine-phosphate kinase [Acidobacteriota bacterium]
MKSLSEVELHAWLRRVLARTPGQIVGVGDDCAVLEAPPGELAVTTDMLVEGVDFRRGWYGPELLARRACRVNLSDLAAMGARPWACLLALAWPREMDGAFGRRFLDAFRREAEAWGMPVVGGDLSAAERVTICVTALGSFPVGRPVQRSGARAGDLLVVFGDVGWSRWGLELLEERECRGAPALEQDVDFGCRNERDKALRAHILPAVLVGPGAWLRERGLVRAMIDVSDGLGLDVARLAQASGLRAVLRLEAFPAPAGLAPRDWWNKVVNGGEDFALVAALSPGQLARVRRAYPGAWPAPRVIGRLVPGRSGVVLTYRGRQVRIPVKGFDHFA